ncbi:MAG: OFA family MFS transporter [Deltaproteobacteria bacterium]|nr:OFA family MFS transporter [Deltaproteobacteria bacterium]
MSQENLMSKRWVLAGAGVALQLILGTVYAWSVFKKPLMGAHGWSETATQATFMIIIFVLGISAAFGGALVDKKGPKFVALIGALCYGIGTLCAGLADMTGSLFLLYVGYGVIGGLGNGFGYVVPIATLIRWFPDKRGLVTGLAVMGFGAGAFFVGKIAPDFIVSWGVANTFFAFGAVYLVVGLLAAAMFKNPPKGWLPDGYVQSKKTVSAEDSFNFEEARRTPQWYMLWSMLFLNVSAGLGLLSQLSPMAQDILRQSISDPAKLAVEGGFILAIASIFNGLGRLFWAAMSDKIGRKGVFLTMFASQAVLYVLLPKFNSATMFTVAACYLMACYGGGFAVMPSFAADSFGPTYIGKIYGAVLTAWGFAGVAGPLVFAQIKGAPALYVAAALLVAGFVITLAYKRPEKTAAPAAPPAA